MRIPALLLLVSSVFAAPVAAPEETDPAVLKEEECALRSLYGVLDETNVEHSQQLCARFNGHWNADLKSCYFDTLDDKLEFDKDCVQRELSTPKK